MFHSEPDGVFQAYDAKTGDELWRFQTGEVGLGGGAGPSGAAAMTYEIRGEQFVALANNRAVWAFKIGGTVPPRPAPAPPATRPPVDGPNRRHRRASIRGRQDVQHCSGEQEDRLVERLRPESEPREGQGRHNDHVYEYQHHVAHDCGTRRIVAHRPDQGWRGGIRDDHEGRHLRIHLHGSPVDDRAADRRVTMRSRGSASVMVSIGICGPKTAKA